MITIEKIKEAQKIIAPDIRKTDLILASNISGKNNIYLKTENFQATGSFKVRGAAYKISKLSDEEKARGIIACSAGNHAQGVARAAQKEGIKCTICMPAGAPLSKVESTKSFGAEIVFVKDTYDDAYAKAVEIQKETGATFVHPFNDEDVIAGQGTIGLEILEQLPETDAVIAAVGGGGLVSGLALAVKSIKPECKVYGVQSMNAPAMYNSFRAHQLMASQSADTFADGIAVKAPGNITYDCISKYVDDIALATEDEIAAAVLMLLEKQKIVAEGAGASPVAAAYFDKFNLAGKNIVCVISGGNIDVNILNRVITRGMILSGRRTSFTIAVPDKPGQLTTFSSIISEYGGNVIDIQYSSSDPLMPVNSCFVNLLVETRDANHAASIRAALLAAGFNLV